MDTCRNAPATHRSSLGSILLSTALRSSLKVSCSMPIVQTHPRSMWPLFLGWITSLALSHCSGFPPPAAQQSWEQLPAMADGREDKGGEGRVLPKARVLLEQKNCLCLHSW